MKRILFVTYIDLLKPIDFSNGVVNGNFRNSGDTVYFSAGMSYFMDLKNVTIMHKEKVIEKIKQDPDFAKKNFDIVITMVANIFSKFHRPNMLDMADFVKSLKVPVYILGAGCQSDINYSFDFLNDIKDEASLFLDSILNSGGDITLRGDFTKEALEKLGYKNLFVSGCPSLYLLGQEAHISNNKVSKENFKPMLCGGCVEDINKKIYRTYKSSVFFDQDVYLKYLYKPDKLKVSEILKTTPLFLELYQNDRIKGFLNYYPWIREIIENSYNFSYGKRIHGNIIALQNNIPAFVKAHDSRTREIAQFYNIPNSFDIPFDETKDELYDLYKELDYTKFNETYKNRFNSFVDYLENKKISNLLKQEAKEYIENISKMKYLEFSMQNKKKKDFAKLKNRLKIFSFVNNEERIDICILGIKIKYKKRKGK